MSRTLRLFAGAAAMLVVAVGVAVVLKDEPGYEAGRLEISGKIEGLTEYQENRAGERAEAAKVEVPKVVTAVPQTEHPEEKTAVRQSAPPKEEAGVQPTPSEEKAEVRPAEVSEQAVSSAQTALPTTAAVSQGQVSSLPVMSMQPEAGVSSKHELELPASADVFPGASPSSPAEAAAIVETAEQNAPELPDKEAPSVEAQDKAVAEKKASEQKDEAVEQVKQTDAPQKEVSEKPSVAPQSVSAVKDALAEVRSSVEGTPEAAVEKSSAAPAEKPAQRYERVVTSAKFSMKGSLIKLVLQGNAPMVGHYSILGNPDRVVLDLAGNWEITVPRVPSNRLIQAVRVGQHEDKTRIVFDMKTMGRVALVPLNRNSLELSIQ